MSVIDRHSTLDLGIVKRRTPAARLSPAPQCSDCVLTTRDYALLEVWLMRTLERGLETDSSLISLVREKLAAAQVVLSGDEETDRAKGGSRVLYTLDGAAQVSKLLAHWSTDAVADSILPITSMLGISLLGMRASQRVPLIRSDGSLGGVWLDAVSPYLSRTRTG